MEGAVGLAPALAFGFGSGSGIVFGHWVLRDALSRAPWVMLVPWAKHVVRWLSVHTGLPALVVAAVLLAVGYRILKRSFRLLVEVALVAAALAAASGLGWIRW
jgi:hypothetical protein